MEYFKYKAQTDFLDSGKLTGDVVSAVSGISERKKKASAEVQKQFDDVQTELNNWQATKTTDLNELAIKGVEEIRRKNKELADKYNRGEIDAAQYKVATTNLKNTWGSWAKGAQNFDSQLQALIERQNSGEGGEAEAANIRYLAEYGNLINKSWNVKDDGNILLVEKDKNGNVIRFDDSKFIFNPGNNVAVKVNLDKDLDKDISYWQTWKLTNKKPDGTEYSLEDMRQNPAFQNAAISLQNKFTATPQQTASVLADNGQHQIAINDAEANRFLDEMVSKEQQRREYAGQQPMNEEAINEFKEQSAGKIIVMKRDKSGQMIPDITPDQLKEARKIINDKIEINLGRVESKNEQTNAQREADKLLGKNKTSTSSSGNQEKIPDYSSYEAVKKSWDTRDPSHLNAVMNKNGYATEWDNNKKLFIVYELTKTVEGVPLSEAKKTKIGEVKDPAGFAPYIYKSSADNTAYEQYTQEQAKWNKRYGSPSRYRYERDGDKINLTDYGQPSETTTPKKKTSGSNKKGKGGTPTNPFETKN